MSENADVKRMMTNLRVRLPGAIDDALRLEVFNTLNEFFQDSNIWTEQISVDVQKGVSDYDITPDTPSSIVRLMWFGNLDTKVPTLASMNTMEGNAGQLHLEIKPESSYTAAAVISLTVNDPLDRDGDPVFPDWVLNKYQNDIIDGVLARMMSQAAKPYTNPQMAVFHAKSFKAAVAFARIEANRHNVYGAQAWGFPQSFMRRRTHR